LDKFPVEHGGRLSFRLLLATLDDVFHGWRGQSYDGWRLTYHGYDFLALRVFGRKLAGLDSLILLISKLERHATKI